jgi:hypothetical protein
MTAALGIAVLVLVGVCAWLFLERRKLQEVLSKELHRARQEKIRLEQANAQCAERMQAEYDQKVSELEEEGDSIRAHYEKESQKERAALEEDLEEVRKRVGELSQYAEMHAEGKNAAVKIARLLEDAASLFEEAKTIVLDASAARENQVREAKEQVKDISRQGEALIVQARADAGNILREAEGQAKEVGKEAYEALENKKNLEMAVRAMNNVVQGYGDRYIVPSRGLLDELAEHFGHLSAGEALRIARLATRKMVEGGEAGTCDYSEKDRRETAIRFVVDAFNGRAESILARVRHDNHGTLQQELRDAFALVNHNGEAFRNARIQPHYFDARMEELRWAVVVQELKRKEKEEQQRIQEQIREEEKARRDIEKAMEESKREEDLVKKAMEKAMDRANQAVGGEKKRIEEELENLKARLAEAEAKNQRALSMAQQTRAGCVYVISNVGSFGEDVVKIGMTRRLEPMDRVRELGDASVPFEFDVHAIIKSDDAPKLERDMHAAFDDCRVNRVNYRKEFFRVPIAKVREFVSKRQLETEFTMTADAQEYRESIAERINIDPDKLGG